MSAAEFVAMHPASSAARKMKVCPRADLIIFLTAAFGMVIARRRDAVIA
jgi:hypothetical protein